MPQPINPSAMALGGTAALLNQFSGYALGSIIAGVVSIGVPIFTSFYFPILPIFGAIGGIRAIMRGKLIGGLVGIALNVVGGIISLMASGILNPGGS